MRKYVQTVKTYSSADANSDHNPVVMDFRIRCFTKIRKAKLSQRIDIRKLQKPELRAHVGSRLEGKLKEIQRSEQVKIGKTWDKIKITIMQIQIQDIGYSKVERSEEGVKKEWMTVKIMELMAERRIQKLNPLSYELNRKIRRKYRGKRTMDV